MSTVHMRYTIHYASTQVTGVKGSNQNTLMSITSANSESALNYTLLISIGDWCQTSLSKHTIVNTLNSMSITSVNSTPALNYTLGFSTGDWCQTSLSKHTNVTHKCQQYTSVDLNIVHLYK